jgi:uncharacterized membrane protein YhaH (DUF805 family)
MELIENYLAVVKRYVDFDGRARRREYWLFVLCNMIISVVFGILSAITRGSMIIMALSSLYSLAVLLPGLGVSVRRLHDTGKSGLYLFMVLIPIAGPIILLVRMATAGNPAPNQYGPNPKM